MDILAYIADINNGQVYLLDSDGQNLITDKWEDLISFLLCPANYTLVWNVDKFVSTISEIFPKDIQEKLKTDDRVYLPSGAKLFYVIGRQFAITYLNNETTFYGLSRYSDNEPKNPTELKELAEKVLEAYKVFGIDNPKLSSPVAAFGEKLSQLPFPRSCNLPQSSLGMTDLCSKYMTEEWREVFKLGHWQADECSDVDICGAYSSLISRLPDISKAKFWESKKIPDDYSWGIMEGNLRVDRNISPFQDMIEIHRKGLMKDQVISTDGLWLINKYGGHFSIKHGFFYKLPQKVSYPFNQTMRNLYTMREYPNKLVQSIAKQISVGVYGQLAQRYPNDKGGWKLGKNFNSIYSYQTTSRCSLKIADFIYKNQLDDSIISVTVDGCNFEGKIDDVPQNKDFGKFRLNEATPFLVMSQLNQWGGTRKPNGYFYDDMIQAIKEKPNSSIYHDVDINLLEYTRQFPKKPRCGKDLLENKYPSLPIKI